MDAFKESIEEKRQRALAEDKKASHWDKLLLVGALAAVGWAVWTYGPSGALEVIFYGFLYLLSTGALFVADILAALWSLISGG